jgi:hypothetical protein
MTANELKNKTTSEVDQIVDAILTVSKAVTVAERRELVMLDDGSLEYRTVSESHEVSTR